MTELGINCIELLPIEDTAQTLDWGYGTRFYFAPDYELASAVDTRFFVKVCHQRGIRVVLDVVKRLSGRLVEARRKVTRGSSKEFSYGRQTIYRPSAKVPTVSRSLRPQARPERG